MTDGAPVTRAEIRELVAEARGIRNVLGDVLRRDRSRRIQVLVLAGSVAFDILLSVVIIINNHDTRQLVEKVERTSNAAVSACLASNESAVKQHQLWDGLLALPQPKGTPPTPPDVLAAFNRLLDETFVQQDCTRLKR